MNLITTYFEDARKSISSAYLSLLSFFAVNKEYATKLDPVIHRIMFTLDEMSRAMDSFSEKYGNENLNQADGKPRN